jgi:hypothetical protein
VYTALEIAAWPEKMRAGNILIGISAVLAGLAIGDGLRTKRLTLRARIWVFVAAVFVTVALLTR